MSQFEKLKDDFKRCRGTFRYGDFERLLGGLGYAQVKAGKTGGSRRKFMNATTEHLIVFHEPHDGEMKQSLVRDVREQLKSRGLL